MSGGKRATLSAEEKLCESAHMWKAKGRNGGGVCVCKQTKRVTKCRWHQRQAQRASMGGQPEWNKKAR